MRRNRIDDWLPEPEEDEFPDPDPDTYTDLYPDEEEIEDLNRRDFHRFEPVCPNCRKPITSDMDNCPYCGDILFRYLRDGTFAPRKGLLAKFIAVLIILLVLLAVIAFLLQAIFPFL